MLGCNKIKLSEILPQSSITKICQQLLDFPESQYTQRLQTAMQDPNVTLYEFWMLAKDCLFAWRLFEEKPSLNLFFKPSIEQIKFAQDLGLSFDAARNALVLHKDIAVDYPELFDVYKLREKRKTEKVEIDPALSHKLKGKYTHYTSNAQREAVRTTLLSEPGSTIVVNLPTGCGKTFVAHSCALFSENHQLTIVVVPTIALAIEQGQRAKEFLDLSDAQTVKGYCWHSGLNKSDKDNIRLQIDSGQQRVLFVSPESLTKSLLPLLFRQSKKRMIANIVIDEAHLIDTWGAGFRPEFQRVGPLILSLKRESGHSIKTILMSATFTNRNLNTVKKLFCAEGNAPIIYNGSFLRQEMFIAKKEVSKENHMDTVINKITHCPKPMIVYTSLIEQSTDIMEKLISLGVTRCKAFTGETDIEGRELILKQWKNNDLDIIVATSAFGVGMDKGDIRTVIHASIPENLDRYYQEIGRAGRDGLASYCEIVYHKGQLEEARGLNRDAIITVDVGHERWALMKKHGKQIHQGSEYRYYQVDLRVSPERLNRQTDSSTKWNVLTLLLMQRSGLIELLFNPVPSDIPEDKIESEIFWANYHNSITVKIIDEQEWEQTYWQDVVEKQRQLEMLYQKEGLSVFESWLFSSSPGSLCQLLYQFYELDGIKPSYACGSCPECREKGKMYMKSSVGHQTSLIGLGHSKHDEIEHIYFKNDNKSKELIAEAFIALHNKRKVSGIVCSKSITELVHKQHPVGLPYFWAWISIKDFEEDEELSNRYSVVIIDDKEQGTADLPFFYTGYNYFFANEELKEPKSFHRRWWEAASDSISLINFMNKVGA
ncbi:protein DpdF [Moritella dasanensis]|uniref:protein DpdF n=1 Tax=Moritella dasanensis TaxID=428031 RepID=UPI000313119F|nr:protein DpdF [Moritella dasanensis]